MGCDIHCIIEFKHKDATDGRWDSFGNESINPGRDYEWFANLAGVRGNPKNGKPLATGFGLPESISFITSMATSLNVREDGSQFYDRSIERYVADSWVKSGMSQYVPGSTRLKEGVDLPSRVTNPDWHSYCWCNAKDWKKSVRGTRNLTIKAMNAIIDTYAKNNCDVRVICWFDN